MSFLPVAALPADEAPPCSGLWAIFDSNAPSDHKAARQLCARCPVRRECDDVRAESTARSLPGFGPRGTWAGRLHSRTGARDVA